MKIKSYPQLGVGAVVFHEDCVLLVKRNSPPAIHQWAIPGGKVNFGETLQAAAEREILEETGLTILAREPIYSFEVIEKNSLGELQYHYVVIDLEADYLSGLPQPADDVADAAWIDRKTLLKLDVNQYTRDLLKSKYDFP